MTLGMVFRETTPHQVKCDLCHKVTHHSYRIKVGDFMYRFCSGIHANIAIENYKENKSISASPVNPDGISDDTIGENI